MNVSEITLENTREITSRGDGSEAESRTARRGGEGAEASVAAGSCGRELHAAAVITLSELAAELDVDEGETLARLVRGGLVRRPELLAELGAAAREARDALVRLWPVSGRVGAAGCECGSAEQACELSA